MPPPETTEPDRAQVELVAGAERGRRREHGGFLLPAVSQVELDFGRGQGFEHPQHRAGVHHFPARRSVTTLAIRRCRVSSVFACPMGSTNPCFRL